MPYLDEISNLFTGSQKRTSGQSMEFSLADVLKASLPGYGIDPSSPEGREMLKKVRQESYNLGMSLGPGAMVFHGSPHLFDAFKMEKIGTGEGAQAYGHGLYFAENPGVAKSYIPQTAHQDTIRKFLNQLPEDADFEQVRGLIGQGHFTPQQENVLKELDKNDWLGFDYPSQAISQAYRSLKDWDATPELVQAVKNSGNLYKVDLPDEAIGKMLDWDKPLSQQPESIKKLMSNYTTDLKPASTSEFFKWYNDRVAKLGEDFDWNKLFPAVQNAQLRAFRKETGKDVPLELMMSPKSSGEQFWHLFNEAYGPEEAAKALNRAGIPGIKYLDQGSRAGGKGTYNYVVFDENLPKIVGRE